MRHANLLSMKIISLCLILTLTTFNAKAESTCQTVYENKIIDLEKAWSFEGGTATTSLLLTSSMAWVALGVGASAVFAPIPLALAGGAVTAGTIKLHSVKKTKSYLDSELEMIQNLASKLSRKTGRPITPEIVEITIKNNLSSDVFCPNGKILKNADFIQVMMGLI